MKNMPQNCPSFDKGDVNFNKYIRITDFREIISKHLKISISTKILNMISDLTENFYF